MMKLIKSKKVTRLALAGAILMTLLSGCEYDYMDFPEPPPITTELKFSSDIIPIFNESCNMSGCHSAGAFEPDLSAANAYASLNSLNMIDTAAPSNSIIYKVMATGSMKSYSTPIKAQTVLTWIQQGAKNN